MRIFTYIYFFFYILVNPLLGEMGGHGYHEWSDELNNYGYQEAQFHDVVPITPFEDPNPVFYDYSPYLDPEYNPEYAPQ